jgi:hypothetical protein
LAIVIFLAAADAENLHHEHGVFVLPVHEVENFFLHPATVRILLQQNGARRMQGLKKILRALGIVIFPVAGAVIVYGSSSAMETLLGLFLILVASGLIATWFW